MEMALQNVHKMQGISQAALGQSSEEIHAASHKKNVFVCIDVVKVATAHPTFFCSPQCDKCG